MKNEKRVSLTVESEPFEELRALLKELGLPNRWISDEFSNFCKTLVPVFRLLADQRKQQAMKKETLTEQELVNLLVGTIEKAQGISIKDILKKG
jgi:hypothetical protein